MGEVDHVHDPEDERQARGDQEQKHAELHTVEELQDEQIHHGRSLPRPSGDHMSHCSA